VEKLGVKLFYLRLLNHSPVADQRYPDHPKALSYCK
jgi:hypothetical protein